MLKHRKTEMKTVDIKGKDYVMINERIKFFRSEDAFKGWSLESDILSHDNGAIVIKATIKDADGIVKATGLAREKDGDGYINKTSYVENCETSAWGRALGNMGIGVDASIASADEVANAMKNQKGKVATPKKNMPSTMPWLHENPKAYKEVEMFIKDGKLTDLNNITKFRITQDTRNLLTKLIQG